jgi:hypothetical protein
MLLIISIVFGLLPLAGIGFMAAGGYLFTVDGLFMTLILLALSGVFLMNAGHEMRKKRKPAVAGKAVAQKAS